MPVVDGFEQDFAGRLQVVRLNFNDSKNAAAIRALGVRGHPTIVLIDRRGTPQPPLLGVQTDAKPRPKVEERSTADEQGSRLMHRSSYQWMWFAVGGSSLLLLTLVGLRGADRGQADRLQVFSDAPGFALTDHLDRPVNSADLRGTVVLADFVYTSCRDICPFLSAQMQAIAGRPRREKLLGSRVQLLSFTVDPARDTPAVLRAYAGRYEVDPRSWRFLTGPEDEVVPLIVHGFSLGVDALPPANNGPAANDGTDNPSPEYDVMHSTRFVLIDRQWRIRAYYDGRDLDLERIEHDIRELLR